MKHKKRGYLCLLLTGLAITTFQTTHATFTCWKSETIKKYNWEAFRSIFQKMAKASDAPQPKIQPKTQPKIQTTTQNLPPQSQPLQTHKASKQPCCHPAPTQHKKNSPAEKSECDCMLCQETISSNELVELACCKGKKACKDCLEKLHNPTETVQDPTDPTVTHPQGCYYARGARSRARAQTRAYETATPQSQPSWTWKQIGQYWYFLEGDYYWRYAGTNTAYGTANGVFWRYIPVVKKCPFCMQPLKI